VVDFCCKFLVLHLLRFKKLLNAEAVCEKGVNMRSVSFFSLLFLFFSASIFSCDHSFFNRDYFRIHGCFYDDSFADQKRSQRQKGSNNNSCTVWQSAHGDASLVLSPVLNDVLVHMSASSDLLESSQSTPSISRSVVVKRSFDRTFDALRKIHKQRETKQKKRRVDREFERFEARLKQEEDFFAQRTNQVKEYGQKLSGERRDERIVAIQEAVSNNFKVTYMAHNLDSSTLRLLREKGIDPVSFEICLGNAIKQQIHAEFVAVLNESAELFLSGGADQLDTDWFCTIANCSEFGRQVNDACQYSLAHKFSDICCGIYKLAENCMRFGQEVCQAGKETIEEFYSKFSEQLEQAFLTSKHVLSEVKTSARRIIDGAYVEPFRQFVHLAYLTRHHPQLVAQHALKGMCNFADLVLKEAKLVKNIFTDPFSAKTLESISSFEAGYAAPFRATVYQVVDGFSKLSTREKIEKSLAVALQLATIKLPGFLIKKGADGAACFGGALAADFAFAADSGVAISAPICSRASIPIASTAGIAADVATGSLFAIADVARLGVNGGPNLNRSGKEVALDPTKKITFLPKNGATINGRYYSKHALERMAENTHKIRQELTRRALVEKGYKKGTKDFENYVQPRGIHPSRVEETIRFGKKMRDRISQRWKYKRGKLTVVANEFGDVITVFEHCY